MLRIGVLGAGHLGKIHLKCIQEVPLFSLVGFYDPDEVVSAQVQMQFGVPCFGSPEELIAAVDVVDIVTPTLQHFALASKALRQCRHVFIEKPIVATPEEALRLMHIATEANVKVQVGHVERFNPAYTAARSYVNNPLFIESHRLSGYNPRGTDVPVVLDLMIHDIDLVLHLVDARLRRVSASGARVLSHSVDIANARLEFSNGCVANLTASRISLTPMRKTRIFQDKAYISIDFLLKQTQVVRLPETTDIKEAINGHLPDTYDLKKILKFETPEIVPVNAIAYELASFADAIKGDSTPDVTLHDGYHALKVAYQIMDSIQTNL